MDHEAVPHYSDSIDNPTFGMKEICGIINGVLLHYPLLSPGSKREIEEWISEYCRDLLNKRYQLF
jgi:hypothetical protein